MKRMDLATSSSCNLCGSSGPHRIVLHKDDDPRRNEVITLYRCPACHGVFLNSIPESFDDELYSYYVRHQTRPSNSLYPALTNSRYLALLERWEHLVPGRHLLDVGCGIGAFVKAAVANGWAAKGIDLAEAAIDIGCSHGLPISQNDFFSDAFELGSQDMITMFEFIEHVPNPGKFLQRAEEILKPGGLLYVTTPNFNSIDRLVMGSAWDVIHHEHLSYFTPSTLAQLVSKTTDFEILETHAKNISTATLKAFMHRRRSEGAKADAPESDQLRQQIEDSALLRRLKYAVNIMLDASRLGSAMTMMLRKRASTEVGGDRKQ